MPRILYYAGLSLLVIGCSCVPSADPIDQLSEMCAVSCAEDQMLLGAVILDASGVSCICGVSSDTQGQEELLVWQTLEKS